MESALFLRSNTLPLPRTPLPLSIPSANLQFSFRRHSSFSSGKSSRSYRPTRQILRPIITSAVLDPFPTSSSSSSSSSGQKNKDNDQNVAKRVERACFTLACVIGMIIGYSFFKQEALAALLEVGKCSSQMESVAGEGMCRKKPCPPTKANPYCKCRRVAAQTGSHTNRNENLQKPNSDISGDKQENLQKPISELPGDNLENLQKPNSDVSGDKQENIQKLNSELPGDNLENLPKPNSEVPGDKQENLQNVNSEVPGDTNENLQKLNSEVAAPGASQAIDKSEEDPSPSKSVLPQQTSSPAPHGGELGSLLTVFSLGGIISEAEKHLRPELQAIITSDVKVDDHSSQSPLLPQQPPSTISKKSLLSPVMAEKHLKSESQEKTSDVKAEEVPQSPSLLQQAPPTVCQKTSLLADMAEKHLKSESQESKQAPLTVSQESILSEDMAEEDLKMEDQEELQGKNRDVKGNSIITTATHSSPSLPSPLVSITFKVDSSAMPSLSFVSPSTITPAEPRPLGRLKSDRDDGTKVLIRGVPVSSSVASVAEQIFADHGDITANCLLKDQAFRANLVEGLVAVMEVLQEFPARKLTNDDLILMQRKVEDLEKVNVDVGWLRERIEAVGPFLDVVESRKKWEAVAAEVGKLGVKLAEQEAKLAQHEGALAKKFAEKAEVESQGSTDDQLRKEDEPVHAWPLNELGILLHAFGFGSLFYLFFMPK